MVLVGICTTGVTKGQAPSTDSFRQEWLPRLSETIRRRRLSFFGHLCRAIKTIPELSKHAFGVLPKTGDAELEDPGKPG